MNLEDSVKPAEPERRDARLKDLSSVRAVILAGGLGTRLRPYTTIIPKPLVPVGERPIIQHIIERLHMSGVTQIDLCVNYLGGLIQAYLSQARLPAGLELRWHWEDEPSGTAGALNSVPDLEDTFIAMNGDVLTGLDFRELVDFHLASGAALTIGTHRKSVGIDLGVIDTIDDFAVAYHEKPTLHYDVSMGVYVYEPRALKYLPRGMCQFPDLVERLLEAGERVATYRCNAPWYDIGTPQEYERAIKDVALISPTEPCWP
jgi:NDP-sugar pyrophosphorylase family protein